MFRRPVRHEVVYVMRDGTGYLVNNLNLIFGTHMVGGEKQVLHVALHLPHPHCGTCTLAHTHILINT